MLKKVDFSDQTDDRFQGEGRSLAPSKDQNIAVVASTAAGGQDAT